MRKVRTMIVAALAASALAIPATAHADGGSCIGDSMQLVHSELRYEAKGGGVRDFVQNVRTHPEFYPWCTG